ncbi:MAG: outer membrane beta-barrel protein [Bacteroidales bacterium]
MKKIAFLFIAVLFSMGIASAQFVTFGIKGGLNYSKLNFDDVKDIASSASTYNLQSDEAFQGFHVGAFARLKVFSLYIQPELYFTTAGGNVLVEETPNAGAVVESVRQIQYNKIDLPVLVGFKLGPLRINAGPVATVLLSEDNGVEELIPELEALSKSATIGYQAGAGLDLFKFLTLDYRFEGSLSKYGDKFTVGGTDYPFDSRANIHLISLGIFF